MKTLLALTFLLIIGVTTMAQTRATATIQVTDRPHREKILVVGIPSGVTFEIAYADPENGNVWIDLSSVPLDSYNAIPVLTQLIFDAINLQKTETGVSVESNGHDTLTLTAIEAGSAGNDYVLLTDFDGFTLTGFSGGSD